MPAARKNRERFSQEPYPPRSRSERAEHRAGQKERQEGEKQEKKTGKRAEQESPPNKTSTSSQAGTQNKPMSPDQQRKDAAQTLEKQPHPGESPEQQDDDARRRQAEDVNMQDNNPIQNPNPVQDIDVTQNSNGIQNNNLFRNADQRGTTKPNQLLNLRYHVLDGRTNISLPPKGEFFDFGGRLTLNYTTMTVVRYGPLGNDTLRCVTGAWGGGDLPLIEKKDNRLFTHINRTHSDWSNGEMIFVIPVPIGQTNLTKPDPRVI